jgi:NAD(P)-dependent dehydrogenase (short-subunit alcohol dehydrogenase family)
MNMTLDKKTILITGGAGTIGGAVAKLAHKEGAKVLIWDRDVTPIRDLASKEKWAASQVDVCNEQAVVEAFNLLVTSGRLPDIVVNAAGIFTHLRPLEALALADFEEVIHTNVAATFLCCREAIRHCGNNLVLINISSSLSQKPIPMAAAYAASKAAIDSLTRSIAIEYGAKGVRAVAINPGPVEGRMLTQGLTEIAQAIGAPNEAIMEKIIAGLPTGKVVTADEVAALAIFLAGRSAHSINGQTINLDGGFAF